MNNLRSFISTTTPIPLNRISSTKPKPHFATPIRCTTNHSSLLLHRPQPTQETNSLLFYRQDVSFDDHRNFFMLHYDDDQDGILVNPRFQSFYLPDDPDDDNENETRYFSQIIGSCNGLVCLAEDYNENDPIHICNPITGEYLRLPEAQGAHGEIVSGFAFDHVSNQYKVLRMLSYLWNTEYTAEVYTFGTGHWRKIGYTPYPLPWYVERQFFINGALHWLIPEHSLIMTFDVATEEFGKIPIPPELVNSETMHLMDLGGYLCLVNTFHDRDEIWVLKEYGVKGSWTKEWVVPSLAKYFTQYVKLLKNGNILMHAETSNWEGLICFDPVTKEFRNAGITKIPTEHWCNIVAHARSPVSVRDTVGPPSGYLVRKTIEEKKLINLDGGMS